MLVAVVSDSHNNSEAVDLAKKAIAKCDALLFLGDGESDLEKLTEGFKGEVYAVCGNCDFKMMNPVERIVILNTSLLWLPCSGFCTFCTCTDLHFRGWEIP